MGMVNLDGSGGALDLLDRLQLGLGFLGTHVGGIRWMMAVNEEDE